MDWPYHRDPYLDPHGANVNDFRYGESAKGGMNCEVLQCYERSSNTTFKKPNDGTAARFGLDGKVARIVLEGQDDWLNWFHHTPIFDKGDNLKCSIRRLPKKGLCIFFIPRVEDLFEGVPADFTDLPITSSLWDQIAKAFYLHCHIVKTIKRKETSIISISHKESTMGSTQELRMHTAMVPPLWRDSFALASTHFCENRLTLAVMFGCSSEQIGKVKNLLEGREDAVGTELLMLGICAELHLDRLRNLAFGWSKECYKSKDDLEKRNQQTLDWDLIKKVGVDRAETKKAEEEIKATKRQLYKALPSVMRTRLSKDDNATEIGHNLKGSLLDNPTELPELFLERFADIFAQFEGLVATCWVSVEELSFTADAVKNELARQVTETGTEAAQSGNKLAQASSVIATVAMLYLPVTAVAAIFTMPVFQFSNDWRNWKYQQVDNGDSSGTNSAKLPVFSGYFWIYLGISAAVMLCTIEAWWQFNSGDVERLMDKFWTTHLIAITLRGIKKLSIYLWVTIPPTVVQGWQSMSRNIITHWNCFRPRMQPVADIKPDPSQQPPQDPQPNEPKSPPPQQSSSTSPGTSPPESQTDTDAAHMV